jgi:hypothetical protein
MRRRSRLLLVGVAIIGSVVFVTVLTALSTASEGPLSATLDRIGASVGSIEYRVRQSLNGSPRSDDLAWFAQYRADAALLRHPETVLLGAYDSDVTRTLEGVVRLEQDLGTSLPLVQIYGAWGDKAEQRFPLGLVTTIWNMGSTPVVTWEPWLTDFENGRHPELPLRDARDRHGLAAVAHGDYDFYVDAWAGEAARFRKPIFLRFAHEMNDPYRYPWGPQNNTKEEYIAAWRHVVSRFRAAGASNVLWVWSPHVAYEYWDTYYPGDGYVDWVATGALNFGTVARWSQWWSFRELFGLKYGELAAFGKPIMVAEFASLDVGGDRKAWYREALAELPREYPEVRALLFFQARADQTVTYQQVDWSIANDPVLATVVADAVRPWTHPLRPR